MRTCVRTRFSWSSRSTVSGGARSLRVGRVPYLLACVGAGSDRSALASAVWLYGTWVAPGTGLDGPCAGYGEFRKGVREGSSGGGDWSWLPPREICIEERLDGTGREVAYPGAVTFAVAGAAFVLPFLFRRRDRVGGPSRAGAGGDRG
jgi:hypothetical protein